MTHLPILSLITFLPVLGALFIFTIRGDEEMVVRNSRQLALWTSLVTFIISVVLILLFDPDTAGFQFVETKQWISGLGIQYYMGVDGISVWFVLLSTFLTPLCVLASWASIRSHVKEYMIAFLVLETMMVGMFCALDFVLFYLFFEGVMIPMFLIIGVWGGPRRIYAAFKFFLYTLAGSVLMLIAVLTLYVVVGKTDIPALMQARIDPSLQYWLWLAFFASFAVKVPMWPVHTWLPDAHVEAPTAGSVILAGVLLKMGAYGFLRFSLPMLPEASLFFQPLIFTLSAVAIIYTSLVALAQEDMKKLIAYSSVAHMGFVTIGIFTVNLQGIEGALFQMLSHGIISSALFLCVGVLYDRIHSRDIASYGGLVHRMPAYALVFMVFTLGALGLPGTSGFIGEFLSLLAAYQVNRLLAVLASTGMVLGAVYMLWLYRRVMLGLLEKEELKSILDLNRREVAVFAPLVVLVLWMGIYPEYFLGFMHASAENLVDKFKIAHALNLAAAAP
ncbi:MAG: NADH-quinone oxidoreductase subunit M [Alphaproteobacteria bacterium]|nr:NADH-quinone oxidoreductase subunit M [Alphaproteobacteria bacterium]MDP7182564.1 NADH-quinone oxidoreductase subunit M [Alphaproteobacteria bacterium]MDP7190725.1 NADH-quinone oxidoreductase subunit M [Alphaproteobacteria bacterium]HJO88336.1 NADH-quinone oxidoreductase subunit M [Alphaproteobacteria bacterium]